MELHIIVTVALALLTINVVADNENSCEAPPKKCLQVAALIPARAGSKGIKDKNLSRIGNETLISRTLRIIKECGKFDSVWVSTDGKNIGEEAEKHGAKVHWRDPKTATDNAPTVSAVEDFLQSHRDIRMVCVIQCTSPFIQKKFLCEALDLMIKSDADCIFSVTRSHQLRWTERSDGFVSPLNFDPTKRPRRQDWQGELVENGMFYFVKSNLVLEEKVLQNNRCKTFDIPKRFSMEIDTEFELTLARTMLSSFEDGLDIT